MSNNPLIPPLILFCEEHTTNIKEVLEKDDNSLYSFKSLTTRLSKDQKDTIKTIKEYHKGIINRLETIVNRASDDHRLTVNEFKTTDNKLSSTIEALME